MVTAERYKVWTSSEEKHAGNLEGLVTGTIKDVDAVPEGFFDAAYVRSITVESINGGKPVRHVVYCNEHFGSGLFHPFFKPSELRVGDDVSMSIRLYSSLRGTRYNMGDLTNKTTGRFYDLDRAYLLRADGFMSG